MLKFKNKKGMSLIEVTLVLSLFGVLLVTVSKSITDVNEMQNARSIAIRQTQVINAARAYMNANMNDLVTRTQGGNIVAVEVGRKNANEAAPTGSLQELGFLPSGFIDVNAYGQNTVLILREGEVDGTVQAIVANHGGRPANDSMLGLATRFIGPMGGMTQENGPGATSGQIYGYAGGWRINKSDFETGSYNFPSGYNVSYIESSNGETIGNFLWRTDTGNPEANRMHTSIDMNGNSLNSVKNITATDEVLHILAKVEAELILPPEGSTTAAATDPSVYQDQAGNKYENYIRPDGYTRLAYLDPSAIISHSDDTVANIGKSYPEGTRLADALPNLVAQASYYAEDNTVVPKPTCGGPTSTNTASLARIYAMPISSFDVVGPGATTSGRVNFTPVNVVSNVSTSQVGNTTTINVQRTQINSINSNNSIELQTAIDTMAIAYGIYAVDLGNSWLFRYTKKNWIYNNSQNNAQGAITDAPIDNKNNETYKNMAMIQTVCYYGN